MALGENHIFSWKSKATQEREYEEYQKWAFPYGELQRENLLVLLKELYPKASTSDTLVPFLTCKELYEGVLKKTGSRDGALHLLIREQKKYKLIIRKNEMTTYLAVVLADKEIDDQCIYPPADEVREKIKELELIKEGR